MSGIIDLLIPREKKFFKYLDSQVLLLDDCIKHLDKSLKNKKKILRRTQDLDRQTEKTLEYLHKKSDEAEKVSREIINLLHQTFITPIDREEIKSLSSSINFIIDSIEKIANGLFYFKIKKMDDYFLKQLRVLKESIEVLKLIFEEPLSSKRNRLHIEKIKTLEREGDLTILHPPKYVPMAIAA
ncbi:MAG: DUF47 family protein [Actinobacteria bacterium]|nr:DUF47 family protein [Actinomycetota bacterium]